MEAKILNYRRGRHTEHTDQFIISVKGVATREGAAKLIGKKIFWETPAKRRIGGKITRTHGNSGAVIARFEKGLPGQALGTDAILE
ncbi:MAG: 50S ribosomal protein L35ae [Candidatus Micrarchaeota archaeon]